MMTKLFSPKNIVAFSLLFLGIALYFNNQSSIVDENEIKKLNIEKPSSKIELAVQPISEIVTDKNDKLLLAIFNREFAERSSDYNASNQQVNDVYVLAAKKFFGEKLKDKYENFDEEIVYLLESCIGSENHILTDKEKEKLSSYFMGLAWSFAQGV